jgi:hypothetical protein
LSSSIEQRALTQDIKRLEIWTDVNGIDVKVVAFGNKKEEWYLNLLKDAIIPFAEIQATEERGITLNWATGADLTTRPISGKFGE